MLGQTPGAILDRVISGLPLFYVYFRTLNVFMLYDDLSYLKIVTDIAEEPSLFFRYFERPVDGIWYRPLLVVTYLHDYFFWEQTMLDGD
jgi:hypothetical protein